MLINNNSNILFYLTKLIVNTFSFSYNHKQWCCYRHRHKLTQCSFKAELHVSNWLWNPQIHCDETFTQNGGQSEGKLCYKYILFSAQNEQILFHVSIFVILRCILIVELREKCSSQILSSNTVFPIHLRIVMKSWWSY